MWWRLVPLLAALVLVVCTCRLNVFHSVLSIEVNMECDPNSGHPSDEEQRDEGGLEIPHPEADSLDSSLRSFEMTLRTMRGCFPDRNVQELMSLAARLASGDASMLQPVSSSSPPRVPHQRRAMDLGRQEFPQPTAACISARGPRNASLASSPLAMHNYASGTQEFRQAPDAEADRSMSSDQRPDPADLADADSISSDRRPFSPGQTSTVAESDVTEESPLSRADLLELMYQLCPSFVPDERTTEQPSSSIAGIFQSTSRAPRPSSLPHTRIIDTAFSLIDRSLSSSDDHNKDFKPGTRNFRLNTAPREVRLWSEIHKPICSSSAARVDSAAQALGLSETRSLPCSWSQLSDIEALARVSLSHLSSVDCISSAALTLLRDTLSPDQLESIQHRIAPLCDALMDVTQRTANSMARVVANCVLHKRDAVLGSSKLPSDQRERLRCLPVTSGRLFGHDLQQVRRDVESSLNMLALRKAVSSSGSGTTKRKSTQSSQSVKRRRSSAPTEQPFRMERRSGRGGASRGRRGRPQSRNTASSTTTKTAPRGGGGSKF